jgi:hypothetical protein
VRGNEQDVAARNALAGQLFGPGPLMARDRWTFVLPLTDNPSLRGATPDDAEHTRKPDPVQGPHGPPKRGALAVYGCGRTPAVRRVPNRPASLGD